MPDTFLNILETEKPMESALNSAHYFSRRDDSHLKYGRYDDAIKYHKETVHFLAKAINESTIPQNIENLNLQRKHHENIQEIIARQKREFEEFLLRNGLKPIDKPNNNKQSPQEKQEDVQQTKNEVTMIGGNFRNASDDNEFFSLVGELKIDDENNSNDVMMQFTRNDSDNEEYFSLL